jgi:tetratricopeptide (TPR) repeat protein
LVNVKSVGGFMEKSGNTLHALRPLFWWLLFVFVLFLIHLHQQLLEKTRLYFSFSTSYSVAVTLDGKPFQSGDNISLGKHHFVISGDKTDPFVADLSIWYGRHDLGSIQLKRSYGTLSVNATPAAQSISISGSEFSTNLQNSSGATFTVPTDSYNVSVQYKHWNNSQTETVTREGNAPVNFAPHFGGLNVSANYKNATFQLQDASGQQIESGDFPKTLTEIPAGAYQLFAMHGNHRLQKVVTVTAGATSDAAIEFQFGKAVFESSPSGAAVYGDDRSYWGQTPLELPEVTPQTLHFQIELNSYQSVSGALNVAANQTATFRTNLVSFNYINAMSDALNNMAQGNYEQALTLINQAIQSKPDDADALALQKKIDVAANIQQAERWATGRSNYVSAVKFLNKALAIEPDNERAKSLLADYQPRITEQLQHEKELARLNAPKEAFDATLGQSKYAGANLFKAGKFTTGKSAKDIGTPINNALTNAGWTVTRFDYPVPDIFVVEVKQTYFGGMRQGVVIGGQITDNQTEILCKVMEYESVHNISIQGFLPKDDVQYRPALPTDQNDVLRQHRIDEGIKSMADCINKAM